MTSLVKYICKNFSLVAVNCRKTILSTSFKNKILIMLKTINLKNILDLIKIFVFTLPEPSPAEIILLAILIPVIILVSILVFLEWCYDNYVQFKKSRKEKRETGDKKK